MKNLLATLNIVVKKLKKSFLKNEIITSYIKKRNQFCILVSGNADLVRYDLNGNRTIVEHFSKNDVFGEVFYTITTNNELLVEDEKNAKFFFIVIMIFTANVKIVVNFTKSFPKTCQN